MIIVILDVFLKNLGTFESWNFGEACCLDSDISLDLGLNILNHIVLVCVLLVGIPVYVFTKSKKVADPSNSSLHIFAGSQKYRHES